MNRRYRSWMKQIGLFFAIMLFGFSMANTPENVLRDTSDKMISALKANKSSLEQNPSKVYSLVEQILVPRFDFETISQFVMGRTWRSATPAQRVDFTQEFKRLLINSYAGVLLEYTDEKINITPLPAGAAASGDVNVRTEIVSSHRDPVAINYQMSNASGQWMVLDISVEGVSIVTNYRSEIRELVRSQGIDGMISTLRAKNRE